MHLRKLTFTVGLVGALCSTWAYGLGLGEIKVNSALNQPLDAEIKLLQVRNLTEEDILIELASQDDFQRFGVERAYFLQQLEFDVQMDHPGGPIVKVTTDQPVREPYLIFLLEAQSPSGGRLLREYTLLMDLPVFADETAQPVQGAQTRSVPQQAQAQPAPAPASPAEPVAEAQPVQRQGEPSRAPAAPQPTAAPRPGVEVYGPVQADDTLWEIAARVRPSQGVSVQQTMLAIQRLNPDAFINGNINLLKRGQVLRVPDQAEIEALDQRAAISEVAVQNDRWSSGLDRQVAGAELQAGSRRPDVQRSDAEPRGQLTLAAPGDTQGVGERSGAGDTSARTESLENELAITSEELDATRRENDELNSRVAELEEQISTMERLLEVSNEQLRALQLAADDSNAEPAAETADAGQATATQADAAEPDTTDADTTDAAAGTADPAGEADSAQAAEAADQATTDAAAEEQPAPETASPAPVAQPTKTVVPRQPQSPSWQETAMDLLMDNLWYLLVAVLTILGGIVLLLHRRGQAEADSFDDEFGDEDIFAEMEEAPADFDSFEDSAGIEEEFDLGEPEEAAAVEEPSEAELPTEAETGDAVSEADIYIAYGKFDQAEEMLQKAVANDPDNLDLRLKLLEVYSESKNVEKFDGAYTALLALGDAAANNRAADLRNDIPGAPPFAGEIPAQDSAEADSLDFEAGDFNFDSDSFSLDSDGDSASSPAGELDDLTFDLDSGDTGAEVSGNDDGSFDFDLDLDSSLSGASESDESEAGHLDFSAALDEDSPAEEDDGSLDFSLDLDSGSEDDSVDSNSLDDLSLDFADLDSDAETPVLTDADDGESESALDLDLDFGESDDGDALSFDLDNGAAGGDSDQSEDSDVLADLEFSTEGLSLDEEGDAADQGSGGADDLTFELGKDSESTPAAAGDGDDDFDMDLSDLDLEALDQEMDALVGEVDDLGDEDDDVAVATRTANVAAVQENTATASDTDLSLDFSLDGDDVPDLSSEDAAAATELPDFSFDADGGEELDEELDFLADADEVATKLDLARAYIDMGDQDGARDILDEVSSEGNDDQKREAAQLLEKMA